MDGSSGEGRVLAEGYENSGAEHLSSDGAQLAWILLAPSQHAPWDGTELWLADVAADGTLAHPRCVAGGNRSVLGLARTPTARFASNTTLPGRATNSPPEATAPPAQPPPTGSAPPSILPDSNNVRRRPSSPKDTRLTTWTQRLRHPHQRQQQPLAQRPQTGHVSVTARHLFKRSTRGINHQYQRYISILFLFTLFSTFAFAQGLNTTASKEDWEEVNFEFNSPVLTDGYPSLLRLAEVIAETPGLQGQT